MTDPTKQDVEQAYAIINAHYAAEDALRVEASRKLVGRCFRTATDPEPGVQDRLWRCAKVTDVDGKGYPHGTMFRITARQGALFDFAYSIYEPTFKGWTEIDSTEFRKLTAIIEDRS